MSKNTSFCGICIKYNRHWEKCYAAYAYQIPISLLIHQIKTHDDQLLTQTLSSFIIKRVLAESTPLPDLLIPVPMHMRKLTSRGYNQSIKMTKLISQKMNIPWALVIKKQQHTDSQITLNRREREKQLIHSFALNKQLHKSIYHKKHIAIIDDVVTTGATTSQIAKILKKSGVKKVDVWCIART